MITSEQLESYVERFEGSNLLEKKQDALQALSEFPEDFTLTIDGSNGDHWPYPMLKMKVADMEAALRNWIV